MGDNASFQVLNISDILPNRFQPRIKFEDESLDELAESISRFGVIEPIVVRPIGNKYEIIAGERRYKASKLASKTTIPSIVISLSDKDSEELALLENVQRQSLNPIEEAVSYKRILDMGYITREELSKKIGKPQSVILNKTRLLGLADEVQSYLLNNKISERHARALLNITNLDDQVEMLHRIVNERLTVKKTNKEIRNYLENNKDDDTEILFSDERGNDKMDIDKLMREAQDINSEPNVGGGAPELMANPASQNNAQVLGNPINNTGVIPQEPNKFVNVQVPVNPAPTLNPAPISNGTSFDGMFNNSVNTENSVNNVSGPVLNASAPVLGEQSTDASSINEEISSIVSDALKNQPITAPISNNNEVSSDASMNNIPDFTINNSVSDNKGLLNNDVPNNEPIIPEQNMSQFIQNNAPEVPVSSSDVPLNESLNTVTPNVVPLENAQISSPTIQVDVAPVQQTNVNNAIPNFAKIVEKLRKCADEIEKTGSFINLEEVDLGNQYKVIFTFDK